MPSLLSLAVFDPRWRSLRLRAALLLYALILVMGSVPGARAEIGLVASGIVLHSLAYGVLAALLFGGTQGTPAARALKAVLGVMAMGCGDELVQSLWPYRHAAIADWVVDSTAATIVALILWTLSSRAPARSSH